MMNESKMMKEIHEIRAKNHLSEVGLSTQELNRKRYEETQEIEKIITEHGLNVFSANNLNKRAI
ncbi:MAG: hypothetical protein LBC82_02760 [Oscillospiraceae bacterium]|jgi:hypothetical protein|nr:hypothetical protein [Oscillospiraceae bacterium]